LLQYAVFLFIPVSFYALQRQLSCLRGDTLSKAVILIIWGRFALSSLGPAAIDTKVAGFSLIALGTIGLTGVGLLITPLHLFRSPRIKAFLLLVALGVFSGALNGRYVPTITFAVTWCFFLVCALLLHRAFELHGPRKVLACLLVAFALPIGGQLLSIGLNAPKIGPDGSLSYIGVFGHEAVFALVLLCVFVLVIAFPWPRPRWTIAAIGVVLACLLFANYRTVMIAAFPMVLAAVLLATGTNLRSVPRTLVMLGLLAFAAGQIGPSLASERFNELGELAQNETDWIEPPELFTAREKDVLSARLYIWSAYVYGHLRSDWPRYLLGHGPDARAPGLLVHAHNEFWRILFEFGIVGFVIWIGIFAQQFRLAFRAPDSALRLAILTGIISMFLAALGTAIFNRPEGMILIAVLCAATWFIANRLEN